MVPLSQPASKQCFTPICFIIYRCASTHFEENQLAPSSTGISPLLSIHPSIFQHRAVQTSTSYHQSFILIKSRSLGFGSRRRDKCPIQTRFHYGSSLNNFNHATPSKSLAHSSTGTLSTFLGLQLLVGVRFHVLFHSLLRVLFHHSFAVLFHYRSFRSI